MNERIKELAVKAGITIVPEPFDVASQAWNATMQNFAELIVAECANVAADHDASDIYEEIREHFGVEV